jgi:L-gulonolactone oxidase
MKNNSGTWISWNENIKHTYSKVYNVKTEKDIIEAVKNSDKVRFFGSKQSSSDIAAGTTTLIDIKGYNKILSSNESKLQITVQSGVLLQDLIESIEEKGWCIPCLPDINTITIGGAIATGTHGTNGYLLSEYITNCKLVLADGMVLEISSEDDLINAVRVSIGTLGVFSEITFQCEPIYTLHLKEGPEKDDNWLANIKDDLKKYDFLRILWLPHTGNGYVIKGEKINPNKEIKISNGPTHLKYRRGVSKSLYKYTSRFPWFTAIANKILYSVFFKSKKEHKGSLYQATVTKSRGSTIELAEWTISLNKFSKVFSELKEEINKWSNDSFIHIPMDIRFVKKDQAWLSYAYNEDIVTMGCVCRDANSADKYEAFKTVENIFIKHGGKPHWAKRFSAKNDELEKLYPKWNDFKNLRKEMDPSNKFLNNYLSEIFNEPKV